MIFLSFKDVKCKTRKETYDLIAMLISMEYKRHMLLFYKATENELIHKCMRRESLGSTTSYEGNRRKGDSVANNSFRLAF